MGRYKYIGGANEKFIKTFKSEILRIDEADIKGYAALIEIEEVNRRLIVGEYGREVCIYDDGHSELNFLPDGENWALSALYDENGEIIEWYIDITRSNGVSEDGVPYCDDLYLDAVLTPDGQVIILDEDELADARDAGDITQAEFDMAYRVLDKLIENNITSVEYMELLCAKLSGLFKIDAGVKKSPL